MPKLAANYIKTSARKDALRKAQTATPAPTPGMSLDVPKSTPKQIADYDAKHKAELEEGHRKLALAKAKNKDRNRKAAVASFKKDEYAL